MKTFFTKYIVSLLAATYFLVVGVGFNVVDYCCQTCENEGIAIVTLSSCSDVHHHTHTYSSRLNKNDKTGYDVLHEADYCQLFRLKTDISTKNVQKLSFQKFIKIFNIHSDFVCLFKTESFSNISDYIDPPGFFVSQSGRTKITLHSILLI